MKLKYWSAALLVALLFLTPAVRAEDIPPPVPPESPSPTVSPSPSPMPTDQTISGHGSGEGDMELHGTVIGPPKVAVLFQVMDGDSQRGLSGVTVSVSGREEVVTDQSGNASVPGLVTGRTYSYTAAKSGYTGLSSTFQASNPPDSVILKMYGTGGGGSGGGGGTIIIPPSVPSPPEPSGGNVPTAEPTALPVEPTSPPVEPVSPKPEPSQPSTSRPTRRPDSIPSTVPTTAPSESGRPGIVIEPEEDTTRVRIPAETIVESAERDTEVQVVFKKDDAVNQIVLAPFTKHDEELVGKHEVWVEQDPASNEPPVLHIIAPEDGVDDALAAIPHNIMDTARTVGAIIRVSFERLDKGGPTGEYILDVSFPVDYFADRRFERQDTALEYDPEHKGGWLVLSNQYEEHRDENAVTILDNIYEKAKTDELGIKARIYNPDDNADLWYEWSFYPEDLKKAGTFPINLYITPTPEENDPIRSQLNPRGLRYQLLSTAHEGALPAKAELRVKNMAGFLPGDTITLLYSNTKTNQLETVYTGLRVGEDGFIRYEIDHCSTYALTAPVEGHAWLWLLLAAALLALLGLLVLGFLSRRKNEWATLLILQALQSGDKTASSLTAAVNAEDNKRVWKENYLLTAARKLEGRKLISTHALPALYHITKDGEEYLYTKGEK